MAAGFPTCPGCAQQNRQIPDELAHHGAFEKGTEDQREECIYAMRQLCELHQKNGKVREDSLGRISFEEPEQQVTLERRYRADEEFERLDQARAFDDRE